MQRSGHQLHIDGNPFYYVGAVSLSDIASTACVTWRMRIRSPTSRPMPPRRGHRPAPHPACGFFSTGRLLAGRQGQGRPSLRRQLLQHCCGEHLSLPASPLTGSAAGSVCHSEPLQPHLAQLALCRYVQNVGLKVIRVWAFNTRMPYAAGQYDYYQVRGLDYVADSASRHGEETTDGNSILLHTLESAALSCTAAWTCPCTYVLQHCFDVCLLLSSMLHPRMAQRSRRDWVKPGSDMLCDPHMACCMYAATRYL